MRLTMSLDPNYARLEFLRNRLYVVRTLVPRGLERYFEQQARFVSAHTSTAIEGNPLNREEAMRVLIEGADESNPDEVSTVNLSEAYEIIAGLATDPSMRIDQGLIRALNSIVLRNLPDHQARNRGKYRVGPSLIIDSVTRAVRYRPPPPEWVPTLMDSFIQSLDTAWQKQTPGPVIAAMAHFGLVSIHPFEDGNGRTARLVADLALQRTGWAADGMLSVSRAIFDERPSYYEVLRETQGEDFKEEIDITPFLQFHIEVMNRAAAQLEERVVAFRQYVTRFVTRFQEITKGFLNERQAMGLAILFDLGIPLSSRQYSKMTQVSQSSAIADLNEMVKKGLVARIGSGKATRYILSPETQSST